MSRRLEACMLMAMLVLVPLRTIAGVASACDLAHHGAGAAHGAPAHDHDGTHHHGPAGDEHCGSAAFAAPPASIALACPPSSERIAGAAPAAAGHVPEHLDPPPLSL